MKKKKKIIGRKEKVDFPELDLYSIDAKIDTGAYSSSIHCRDVIHYSENEKEYVSFVLLDPSHPQYENRTIRWPLYGIKTVKNSFGQTEERYAIQTLITVYNESFPVTLSLADRSAMEYPVLLGRKAIRKKFLVDVSKMDCSYKSMHKKAK